MPTSCLTWHFLHDTHSKNQEGEQIQEMSMCLIDRCSSYLISDKIPDISHLKNDIFISAHRWMIHLSWLAAAAVRGRSIRQLITLHLMFMTQREKTKDTQIPYIFLSIKPKTQSMRWCCPYLGWVFTPQTLKMPRGPTHSG